MAHPMVALILSKAMKASGKGEGKEKVGEELDEGVKATAEEVFAAIKADDVSAFATSIKRLIRQCIDEYEGSEGEENSDETEY